MSELQTYTEPETELISTELVRVTTAALLAAQQFRRTGLVLSQQQADAIARAVAHGDLQSRARFALRLPRRRR